MGCSKSTQAVPVVKNSARRVVIGIVVLYEGMKYTVCIKINNFTNSNFNL